MNDTRYEDAGRRDDPTARRRTMAARAGRKRRRRNRIIVSILIPLGLLILLYPWLSDTWNRNRAERLKVDYDHAVSEIHDTKKEQILEEARAYNESLIGTQVPDAFMDRAVENDPEYENILNPAGNGLMGRVEVPCIHVKRSWKRAPRTCRAAPSRSAGRARIPSSSPIAGFRAQKCSRIWTA